MLWISSLYLSQTFIPKKESILTRISSYSYRAEAIFFIYASYNWTLFYSKTDLDNNMEMSK